MVDVRGLEPLSEIHPTQTFSHDSPCYENFPFFAGKGIRFRVEDVTVYIFLHHCILWKHRKHYADSSILKCLLSDKYIVLEALTQAAIWCSKTSVNFLWPVRWYHTHVFVSFVPRRNQARPYIIRMKLNFPGMSHSQQVFSDDHVQDLVINCLIK